ncbi:Transcription initiation factor TFIID subunit 3 [Pseudolycoriella hygida]|uniref:Transcription initiation factor TFIID subunit 3 n=1 Tax=Pseudolycoriella hygida TaxID=35572 RepID=A0A9Q0MSJ7_9DIPT|nr:Transcription initiation factor TFIID subunit 3 [Pseudolycoriella hygida]
MSENYTQQVLKVCVAQICQTIGWNSIQTTPLELMSDILNKYIKEIATQTHRYSELYGRTEPNLDDVALAMKDMNVNIPDLEEYVNNVDPVPCAIDVPKFPAQKENHLNFLKPGSKEVVTRPVHIHEYLPPMFPEREDEEKPQELGNGNGEPATEVASLPGDENEFSRKIDSLDHKPIRPMEAETRYTREITSVMMTTSGFISPAREGKLPDAKAPIIPVADVEKPPIKEPPSAAVGTLLSSSANSSTVKSEKIKNEKIKPDKMKAKKRGLPAAGIPEKKRKKEKALADGLQGKLAPMGPPPAKQMPTHAAPIYLPNDTPMSAVAEQQKIGKKACLPKIPRKTKVKDPNKPPKPITDGKTAKKPKKPPKNKNLVHALDQLFKVNHPTFAQPMPSNLQMDAKHERIDTTIDSTDQQNAPQLTTMQTMPEQLLPFQPSQPSPSLMFEGKLSTEPDKRKLNIIKRISSKNKEDAVKQGSLLPPHLNLPETSIFPVDDAGMSTTPMNTPMPVNMQLSVKKTPKKSTALSAKKLMKQLGTDMPLNMTVQKPGESNDPTMGLTPKQLKAAARKQMKALKEPKEPKEKKVRVKKERVKAKDKKLKEPIWPNAPTDLSMSAQPSMVPPQPIPQAIPQRKPEQLTPILHHISTQLANHLRGNLGNMGSLRGAEFMQNFAMYPWSGPGLIPGGNPLFPNFPLQPRPRLPFPLPNFEMFNAFPRLKRAPIEKPEPEPMVMPINYEMAQCNVAPLVPASLKLEDIVTATPNVQHNNYLPQPKASFPSSTSISIVPNTSSYPTTKSKPLSPEPKIDNQTIDLTDDPYDDPVSPPRKRSLSPVISPRSDNVSQMQPSKQRRISSSPRHVTNTYNLDDTRSTPDSGDDMDLSNKEKSTKVEKRKDKEHKKDKKDKEGKIKKKKDKKDKTKSKEKSEKRKEKEEKHKDKEAKLKTKKEKKERKREKELVKALCSVSNTSPIVSFASSPGSGRDSDSSIVPKLTLKLGASPRRPDTPDSHRKITIRPIRKEHTTTETDVDDNSTTQRDSDESREPSPELARFSALVTRPPKQKTPLPNESRPYTPTYPRTKRDSFSYESDEPSTHILKDDFSMLPTQHIPSPVYLSRSKTPQLQQAQSPSPMHGSSSVVAPPTINCSTDTMVASSTIQTQNRQSSYIVKKKDEDKSELHNVEHHIDATAANSMTQADSTKQTQPAPTRGRPKGSTNAAIAAAAAAALAAAAASSSSITNPTMCKSPTNITPGLVQRKMNPPKVKDDKSLKSGSAKSSKSPNDKCGPSLNVRDSDGNQVWICPACGRVDDGTPMIGCDGCDAWYHWVCVGIQVPPDANEDWYCRNLCEEVQSPKSSIL